MTARLRLRVDRTGSLTEMSDFREDVHMVGLVVFPCSFLENRICRVGVPKKTDYATLWFVSGVPFPLNVPMYPTGTVFDIYSPKPPGGDVRAPLDTLFSKEYFPFKKDAAFEFVTRVTAHLKLNSVASISAIRLLTFKKDGVERQEEDGDASGSDTDTDAEGGEEEDEIELDEDEDGEDEGQEDVEDEEEGEEDDHEEEGEEDDVGEGEEDEEENDEELEEDDEELEEDVEIDDVEEDDAEEEDAEDV